jgi:hypothetical protein
LQRGSHERKSGAEMMTNASERAKMCRVIFSAVLEMN